MTRTALAGPGFALLLLGLWAGLLWAGLAGPHDALALAGLVGALTWVHVGLFIVAHDAMHGTLVPHHAGCNRALGRLCLLLFTGFSYDRLLGPHRQHHRAPGTPADPDFDSAHPAAFWPWYARFLRRYVSWRQPAAVLLGLLGGVAIGVSPGRLALLWVLPCLLASLQLFAFGTYLPHRHASAFTDAHRARDLGWPFWASLLSCFHFGARHHLHHLRPDLPWWRLWAGASCAPRGGGPEYAPNQSRG